MKPRVAKASKGLTWMVACGAMVGAFEGCDLTAKIDKIGTGHPLTWCDGETIAAPGTTVHVGDKFTKAQCDRMLAARLPQYWRAIEPCIKVEISDNERIAYTSTSYNIGSAKFCGSAMVRDLNEHDHAKACNDLLLYTHASGVFVPGLLKRRRAERRVCLTPEVNMTPIIDALPKPGEKPFEEPPAPPAPPPAKVYPNFYSKFIDRDWWMAA